MKIGKPADTRIDVIVRAAKRDTRKTIKDTKTGKDVENPNFDKMVYEQAAVIPVHDATAEQVEAAVRSGLEAAAKK